MRTLELTAEEQATYAWQFDIGGLGEAGQRRLKGASVMVSRVGGLGGLVALELAAAGVGRLIIAHGGVLKPSDLNRQLLMTHERIGQPRMEGAVARLRALNPRMEIVAEAANVGPDNAARLVSQADIVVDCAPLFEERYAMNREAMARGIPMVEAAVNGLEFHLTTFVKGETGCLRCLYPENSLEWKRRFAVVSPVPGVAASLAAMEVIKLITGLGPALKGRMLVGDLRLLQFRQFRLHRIVDCPVCGEAQASAALNPGEVR